jgi:hypothetical protein
MTAALGSKSCHGRNRSPDVKFPRSARSGPLRRLQLLVEWGASDFESDARLERFILAAGLSQCVGMRLVLPLSSKENKRPLLQKKCCRRAQSALTPDYGVCFGASVESEAIVAANKSSLAPARLAASGNAGARAIDPNPDGAVARREWGRLAQLPNARGCSWRGPFPPRLH